MRKTLPLSIIFICLSAAFSSSSAARPSGPEGDESSAADSLLLEAVLCERAAFGAQDPSEANAALMEKAELCRRAGAFDEALEALGRVRMYLLDPEERTRVLLSRAELECLRGNCDAAISCLREAGIGVEVRDVKTKSEWAGMLLSFAVPAGYVYAGAPPLETVTGTLMTAAAALWTVSQILSGCYVSGILGGAIALNATFMGTQARVGTLIEQYNAAAEEASKREAVNRALGN